MALSSFFLVIMFVLVLVYRVWLQRASMAATLTGRGAKLQPRPRTRGSYAVSAFLFLAVAVTIGLPFLMVLLSSFSRLFGFFHLPDPWTFGHWATVLEGDEFLRAVNQSLMTGAAVAIAGTTIYLGLAWFIARNAFPGKGALSLAIWMPWALPGVLLGTAFLVTAGLGFRHVGVEQGWWPGPDTCTATGADAATTDELLEAIMQAPLVRCDEIPASLLGLSIAGWVVVSASVLAALAAVVLARSRGVAR